MKPLRLKMRGIGPYSREIDIDFTNLNESGLFLITGPTGAGKTSIFDGITFALYGKMNLDDTEKKNGILSDFVDMEDYKNAYVEFYFDLDGVEYRIKRTPEYPYINRNGKEDSKPESCEVEFGDTLKNRKKETDLFITQEIIKLSYDQFKKIMMLAQGSFNEFIKSDSNDKAEILKQIFDTSIYSNFEVKLKEKRAELSKNLETERNRTKGKLSSLNIENSEWSEILKQESINYEKIDTILTDEFVKNEILKNGVEAEKISKESLRDELKRKLAETQTINENIDKFNDAKLNLEKLLERASEIEVLEEKKERYESALKIKSDVDSYENLSKRVIETKDNYERTHRYLEEIKTSNSESISGIEAYRDELKKLEIQTSGFEKLDGEKKNHDEAVKAAHEAIDKIGATDELIKKLNEERLKLEGYHEELAAEKIVISENVILREKLEQKISELKLALLNIQNILEVLDRKSQLWENLENFQEELEIKEKSAEESLHNYNSLHNAWFQSEAYKFSSKLVEGEGCPVCGSTTHPHPAEKPENIPTEAHLEKAKIDYEKLNSAKNKLQGSIDELKKQIKNVEEEFGNLCQKNEISPEEEVVFEKKNSLISELEKSEREIKTLPTRKDLDELEKRIKKSETDKDSIREKLNQYDKEMELAAAKVENSVKEIRRVEELFTKEKISIESFEAVKNEKTLELISKKKLVSETDKIIEKIKSEETRSEEIMRSLEKLGEEQRDSEIKYKQGLSENGFETIENYLDALSINKPALEKEIEIYSQGKLRYELLKEQFKDYEGRERVETEDLKLQEREVNTAIESIEKKIRDFVALISPIKKLRDELGTIRKSQETAELECARIGKLYDISQGKYGNLKNNVSFQNYVLGIYFQEVLDRANIRLFSMTNKQYRMEIDNSKKGNKNSGLELNVYDTHTGKVRSIKTLSGGETFKASMALALGLSDVVQAQNGGIKLDSVFIDEGFGTLDDESLSAAIDVLVAIQNSGRTVGIISHVNELKQIIPAQIIVEKDDRGSRVRVVG